MDMLARSVGSLERPVPNRDSIAVYSHPRWEH